MFNCYFELNEENFDILFVNAIIENLKYGIISLDAMFSGNITDEYYYDDADLTELNFNATNIMIKNCFFSECF